MTLPNVLTLLRLVLAPFVALCLGVEKPWMVWLGASLFACAAVTDGLDGWIARRYAQGTPEGAFLDPLADKVLALAVILPLSWLGIAPVWMVVILVLRDVLTTLLRWYSLQQGEPVRTLAAARAKTFVQMSGLAAIVVLLALWRDGRHPHAAWAEQALYGPWVWSFFLAVTLLAVWTLGLYAWRYRSVVLASCERLPR